MVDKNELPAEQREALLGALKTRFEKHLSRHNGLNWADVQARLEGEYIFYDCSAESPAGRRNVCYDRQALEARKKFKPEDSALDMAAAMGIEILTEDQYRALQQLGNFDTKTSSWLKTPAGIRKLGGAIFADRRYDHVFVYHNGADSYYGARGFRGLLRV
jgi:hypothetical protein